MNVSFDTSPFREHRARFLELLERENAAAVVPSGVPRLRNGDSDYRFRPDSDFYYLTGFREPQAVLVLAPAREGARTVLFVRERSPEEEVWSGRRLGVASASEALGVDEARPIDALWDELPGLLARHGRLVHRAGADEEFDRRMIRIVKRLGEKGRRGESYPQEWADPAKTLHELRLLKSPGEIERMRRAAAISGEAHVAAMRAAAPGKNEAELDAVLEYIFRRRGSTGSAYTSIVAGGANACILHYVENDRPLRDGDLVLVDAGAEWDHYASDVTRTFPVNGRFSPEQRALYELVLAAQKAAIELVRPGANAVEVHERAVAVLVDGLLELGLLAGTPAEVVEKGLYRRFYMHRTGHWLGLDVHDCGAYHVGGKPRPFVPGIVQTVEPGLYVAPDDETVEPRWRGLGIRIEDDLLVTAEGHEVLTAGIPKEVDELETLCQEKRLERVR
jgi:Xaa-Pro aminopeptidase